MPRIQDYEEASSLSLADFLVLAQAGLTTRLPLSLLQAFFGVVLTVGPTGSGAAYETDGEADEVQINQAIAAAALVATRKATVLLLPGTYSIDAPVTLQSNVVLQGAGQGATTIEVSTNFDSAEYWAIGAAGSLTTGTAINAGSNVAEGATTIVGTAGVELSAVLPDDYLYLLSDRIWEMTNQSNREVGEYIKVISVASPNLTIYGMTRDAYTTSNTARMYRVSFVKNCGVRDLSIKQEAALNTRSGNPPPMIAFQKCLNAFVDRVEVYNNDGPGICDLQSIGTSITDSYIHDLTDNTGANRYGYGVLIGGASEGTVVANNRFERMRHAVDAGASRAATDAVSNNGIARAVTISGNTALRIANVPYSTHCEAEGWLFSGNVANGSESCGFYMRGRKMSVISNVIDHCSGGVQIGNTGSHNSSSGSGAGAHVIGNTLRNIRSITPGSTGTNFGGYGIILALTDNVTVQNNSISDCDAAGIRVRQYARRCLVKNNTIVNANQLNTSNVPAIELEGNPSGSTATLTFAAGTVTITGISGLTNASVGRSIVISGGATAGNNGTFTLLTQAGTSATFANPSGATDANNGAISWYIESATDNVFDGNTAINRSASEFGGSAQGRAKYLFRDAGAAGNARNTYSNNVGIGMETSLFSVTAVHYATNNAQDGGVITAGNEKQFARDFPISVRTTSATPTVLLNVPTTPGRNYVVRGYIQGTTGGSGRFYYSINAFFDNNAGTLTQRIASPVTEEHESSSSAALTVAVNGTAIEAVIAAIASAVTWTGRIFISEVRA